jgi:hypothetical protein
LFIGCDIFQDLQGYQVKDLHDLWSKVAEHSVTRQTWIKDMERRLEQVELDRSSMVSKKLKIAGWGGGGVSGTIR